MFDRSSVGLICAVVVLGLGGLGCDQGPSSAPVDPGTPPIVSDLGGFPDTLRAPAGDTVTLNISVTVQDAEGRLDRVVSVVEPASLQGPVQPAALFNFGGGRYGGSFDFPLPETEELFVVRAYAVGTNGRASNRALGQFRFVPTS